LDAEAGVVGRFEWTLVRLEDLVERPGMERLAMERSIFTVDRRGLDAGAGAA
jgi:hypothetical protein